MGQWITGLQSLSSLYLSFSISLPSLSSLLDVFQYLVLGHSVGLFHLDFNSNAFFLLSTPPSQSPTQVSTLWEKAALTRRQPSAIMHSTVVQSDTAQQEP
jgi:hypothetical protein